MDAVEALLLCDAASRDERTGKWTLTGVFDAVWAQTYPAVHGSVDVYFRVRTAGPVELTLVARTPTAVERPLATVQARPNPRGLVEGVVRVVGFELPVAGEYRIELRAAGVSLATAVLTAAALPDPASAVH